MLVRSTLEEKVYNSGSKLPHLYDVVLVLVCICFSVIIVIWTKVKENDTTFTSRRQNKQCTTIFFTPEHFFRRCRIAGLMACPIATNLATKTSHLERLFMSSRYCLYFWMPWTHMIEDAKARILFTSYYWYTFYDASTSIYYLAVKKECHSCFSRNQVI